MKKFALLVIAVTMVAGCASATTTSRAGAPGTSTFTGEVWTWDEQKNTITLRQGTNIFRVNVTPDQFVGLRLNQPATIRGTLAAPAEIERVMTPPPASYAVVPRGAVEQAEVTGKVVTVSPAGVAAVDSGRGPLQVWVATPDQTMFRQGNDVRVRVSVQPVDIIPRPAGSPSDSQPSAAVASEPGDYAVVIGRVLRAEPTGKIVVESPRGPIEVWVSDASKYRVNDTVQVRTSIHSM